MEKKIYFKNVKNITEEFSKSGFIFGDSYVFNVLRGYSTSVNTPCIIIFANGTLDSKESIEVVDAQVIENPSLYLEQNQELAKTVKHILLIECHRLHKVNSVTDEMMIIEDYHAFIKSLMK